MDAILVLFPQNAENALNTAIETLKALAEENGRRGAKSEFRSVSACKPAACPELSGRRRAGKDDCAEDENGF